MLLTNKEKHVIILGFTATNKEEGEMLAVDRVEESARRRRWIKGGVIGLGCIVLLLVLFRIPPEHLNDDAKVQAPAVKQVEQVQVKPFTEHRLVAIPAKGFWHTGGVLAGFAYFFAIPVWILRVLFVFAWVVAPERTNIGTVLFWAYILCLIFMPTIDFIPADFDVRAGG